MYKRQIYNSGIGTIENSNFNNLTSIGNGGSILNTEKLIIINTNISNSKTRNNGGGIYNIGDLNATNIMITTSEATQSGAITYTAGGGIYNAGNMYLLNSSISKTSIGNTTVSYTHLTLISSTAIIIFVGILDTIKEALFSPGK